MVDFYDSAQCLIVLVVNFVVEFVVGLGVLYLSLQFNIFVANA